MRTVTRTFLVSMSILSLCCRTLTGSDNSKTNPGNDKQAAATTPAVIVSASGAQTRVKFEPRCIQTPPAASQESVGLLVALGTTLIPKIASAAVDAGASYLQHRKDELTKSYSGRAAVQLYAPPGKTGEELPAFKYQCIAFVRGRFGDTQQSGGDDYWAPSADRPDSARRKLLGLAADPDLVLELKIERSEDGSAFRLLPTLLEFHHHAAARIGKDKKKDLLFTGTFDAPFKSESETDVKHFAEFQLEFTDVVEGSRLMGEAVSGVTTQWMPLPSSSKENVTVKNDAGKAETTPSWNPVPVSLLMTAQETEDAGDLLGIATKLANDSKDDMGKALGDYLLRRAGIAAKDDTQDKKPDGGGKGDSTPKPQP